MAYRDKRNKKTRSLTIKASDKDLEEIALAVDITGGEFSPSIREAALEWARGVINANRNRPGKASLGVVEDDGSGIRYCFG